jgi:hypothetical protein
MSKKPFFCAIKMFKTVNRIEAINLKDCFDILYAVFHARGCRLSEISVNYGAKTWKNPEPFYDFVGTQETAEFSAMFDAKDNTGIYYGNRLLNQIGRSDEKDFIELTSVMPYEWYDLNEIKGIVAAVDALLSVTYAYICFLPKNYDLGLEKPMKKSFFFESTSVTEDDIQKWNNLKNIDIGYIPKVYPVNFFNSRQLENLKGDTGSIERVSERLSLVTYNEGSKR